MFRIKALPLQAVHHRRIRIKDRLTEKNRRLWAGAGALEPGCGGVRAVERATGLLFLIAIQKSREKLSLPQAETSAKSRSGAPGGGRKSLIFNAPAPAVVKSVY